MLAATALNIPQIEAAAVGSSLAWVLQAGLKPGTEVVIMPDSSYSLGLTAGEISAKKNKSRPPSFLPLRISCVVIFI